MRTLYHFSLNPQCRKVRLHLAEKRLDVTLQSERPWERRDNFFRLNPSGDVPVLDDDGVIIPDGWVISEYLEEKYPEGLTLIPKDMETRLEVRRLVSWMDHKFHQEVTSYLITERVIKRFMKQAYPNGEFIRAGRINLKWHIEYMGYLLEHRDWLTGRTLTLADIAAAAHLSCLDYLDEVEWTMNASVYAWYQRVKSRASMKSLLSDRVPGILPPAHYSNLDF